MKKKDIYIGTLLKNENKEVKTFQKYNQLLDIGNGYYINLDCIRSLKDKLKLYKGLVTNKYSDELEKTKYQITYQIDNTGSKILYVEPINKEVE